MVFASKGQAWIARRRENRGVREARKARIVPRSFTSRLVSAK